MHNKVAAPLSVWQIEIICRQLDQQIRPLLGGEIRWQPAVWKVPLFPAQTMPLIHSLLTIRLFDITFHCTTHLFSPFPPLLLPLSSRRRLKAEETWSCKLICVLYYQPQSQCQRDFCCTLITWTGVLPFFFLSSCSIWLSPSQMSYMAKYNLAFNSLLTVCSSVSRKAPFLLVLYFIIESNLSGVAFSWMKSQLYRWDKTIWKTLKSQRNIYCKTPCSFYYCWIKTIRGTWQL